MARCVYQHPLRTIVVDWDRDEDNVVVLTGYKDLSPDEEFERPDVLILHSDAVASHRFPCEGSSPERVRSELLAFLPEVQPDDDTVVELVSTGRSFDRTWTTVLGYGPLAGVTTKSDIEADMAAISLDGSRLFLGRRGATWWVGAHGSDLVWIDRQPHPESTSLAVFLHEMLDELLGLGTLPSRSLSVFGDQVSPQLLKEISAATQGRLDSIERYNPFRHVRSRLNDADATLLLKRAHLLGCVVGGIILHSTDPVPAAEPSA